MSTQGRPAPGSAVRRHRWGWPAPARKAVVIGLTAAALALSAAAGTTLGFAATDAGGASVDGPRWYAGAAGVRREAPPAAPVAPPTRVRVPRIAVESTLVGLKLDAAGVLEAPTDYAQAGWYVDGTAPGDRGPAVIAGHVDSRTGPAVFYRLHQLRVGDRVDVLRAGAWVPFRVVATERYAKDEFPTERVYGPTPRAELRLITCGGSFDARSRHYSDNVVVYAVDDRPAPLPSSRGQGPTYSW